MTYAIHTHPDVDTRGAFCWVAKHPDLPGCAAHGYTLTEAKERLDEARIAYLANLDRMGAPLPKAAEVDWHVVPLQGHTENSSFQVC